MIENCSHAVLRDTSDIVSMSLGIGKCSCEDDFIFDTNDFLNLFIADVICKE
jgi:hypothetical protein